MRTLGRALHLRSAIKRTLLVPLSVFGPAAGFVVGFHATPAAALCLSHFPCPSPAAPFLSVQSIGYVAQQTAQVGLTGIQQQIWSVEDRIQCLIGYTDPNASRRIFCQQQRPNGTGPSAYADDGASQDPVIDSAFAALGYNGTPRASRSPFVVKAQAPAPQLSTVSYSAWSQGSVDDEVRTGSYAGSNVGSKNLTWAGIGGADVTFMHVTSDADRSCFWRPRQRHHRDCP